MKVLYGYLGPSGTFSEEAALKKANFEHSLTACKTIREVVEKIRDEEVQRGILPLENSLEGSVNSTLDLLLQEDDLKIIDEIIIPIRHNLISLPDSKISNIREVLSHPQAISQSSSFIYNNLPEAKIIYTESTAAAAELIREKENRALVGSRRIKDLYDFEILREDIQNSDDNYTRFAVVTTDAGHTVNTCQEGIYYKTSIVLTPVTNRAGILHEILGKLAHNNINLTRIQSRPTKKQLGEYVFYIDMEGHVQEKAVAEALESVKNISRVFKVLGSYPGQKIN